MARPGIRGIAAPPGPPQENNKLRIKVRVKHARTWGAILHRVPMERTTGGGSGRRGSARAPPHTTITTTPVALQGTPPPTPTPLSAQAARRPMYNTSLAVPLEVHRSPANYAASQPNAPAAHNTVQNRGGPNGRSMRHRPRPSSNDSYKEALGAVFIASDVVVVVFVQPPTTP